MKKTRLKCDSSAQNYEFIIDFVYVNLGLIPPSHYPYNRNGSLKTSLESLGPKDSRIACRKFRKFLRKTQKPPSFSTRQSHVKSYLFNKYVEMNSDNDK